MRLLKFLGRIYLDPSVQIKAFLRSARALLPNSLDAETVDTVPGHMDDHGACSIHDLPDVLLSRVFQEYADVCDFDPQTSYNPGYVSYKARVILCSINFRMRVLAIAMPELWTYIRLGPPPSYPPIPLLELCIARSGTTAPIHVDCYHTPALSNWTSHAKTIDVDEPHVLGTIRLLFPYIHRWKSFKSFFTDGTAEAFADLNLENARSLEEISISSSCGQTINYKVLDNLTRLRELHHLGWFEWHADEGNSPSPQPPSVISRFQWGHLRRLDLTASLSCVTFLQLLSALTSAEVISVNLMVGQLPPSQVDFVPPSLICLPGLLELTVHADVDLYAIFQHVDLPRIKHLLLWLNGTGWNEATGSIAGYRDFIVRVSASLEFGLFELTGFRKNDVVELFDHTELFRIPIADFYIWNYNPSESETADRALKSLADRRPDLRRSLEHQEYFDFVNFGWRSCGSDE